MSVLIFSLRRIAGVALAALAMAAAVLAPPASAAAPKQKTYATPEAASAALLAAARAGKRAGFQSVFGPEADGLGSGDPALAKLERERFVVAYNEKHSLRMDGDARATLVLGNNEWPFPVPLVKTKSGKAWRFDTAAGKEEIVNRRVGRNELYAIQVLMAIADAQRDYASVDRDGDGVREYAPKFASAAGKHDGLYWPAKEGEPGSPLGALVASAVREGFATNTGKPMPYWGYYYRILSEQGGDARGGAYSYVADGKMIGGFAVVAYTAEYGASGVKTFIVNHDGRVFEKDLGEDSAKAAATMTAFNPGAGWVESKGLPLSP